RTSSRFFPIMANRLPESFGAFMHPSFRVYDYFVGVYDGIYWIAQSLEEDDSYKGKMLASDRPAPSKAIFDRGAHLIVGKNDPDLVAFVNNLFAYESYWTGRAVVSGVSDFCTLPAPARTAPAPWREEAHVWQVFHALCEIDQGGRRLSRQGATAALASY